MDSPIWVENPKLKTLLVVLIFVFLFSGLGLVIFAQTQNNYRQKLYEQIQAELPKHQTAKLGIGESDISGWKTYRNEEYGFEFQYPQGALLSVNVNQDNGNNGRKPFLTFSSLYDSYDLYILDNPKGLTLKDYLTITERDCKASAKNFAANDDNRDLGAMLLNCDEPDLLFVNKWAETKIGGNAIIHTIVSSSEDVVYIATKGRFFQLLGGYTSMTLDYSDFHNEAAKILSTFKFTPTP